jgi:hypothetical protein
MPKENCRRILKSRLLIIRRLNFLLGKAVGKKRQEAGKKYVDGLICQFVMKGEGCKVSPKTINTLTH